MKKLFLSLFVLPTFQQNLQLEMEEALQNKEEKVMDIKRITLIETEFQALKVKEEEAR